MNEVDRDLGLALLKRLRQRELITEETFVSACNSRFFDRKRFAKHGEADKTNPIPGGGKQDDN